MKLLLAAAFVAAFLIPGAASAGCTSIGALESRMAKAGKVLAFEGTMPEGNQLRVYLDPDTNRWTAAVRQGVDTRRICFWEAGVNGTLHPERFTPASGRNP